MSLEARKFDTGDPKRADQVRPFKLPTSWTASEGDIFANMLGSGAMISGVGLLFKQPMLAFAGFFFAVAHLVHDKPYSRGSDKDASGGSPAVSLMYVCPPVAVVEGG